MRLIAFLLLGAMLAVVMLIAGISQLFAASEGFTVTTCGVLPTPYTAGRPNTITIDVNGNTCTTGSAALPTGAIPVAATFAGADTTTATAVLAGTAGKTTYICSFSVSGLGSTAGGPVTVTVATLAGSSTLSYTYFYQVGATVPNTPLSVNYTPCVAANAAAAAITVTVPGQAGNTATQINASGFQQ